MQHLRPPLIYASVKPTENYQDNVGVGCRWCMKIIAILDEYQVLASITAGSSRVQSAVVSHYKRDPLMILLMTQSDDDTPKTLSKNTTLTIHLETPEDKVEKPTSGGLA